MPQTLCCNATESCAWALKDIRPLTTWPHKPLDMQVFLSGYQKFFVAISVLYRSVLPLTPVEELQKCLVSFRNNVPLFKALFCCFHSSQGLWVSCVRVTSRRPLFVQFRVEVNPKFGVPPYHYNCFLLQVIKVFQCSSKRQPLFVTPRCKLHQLNARVNVFPMRVCPRAPQ